MEGGSNLWRGDPKNWRIIHLAKVSVGAEFARNVFRRVMSGGFYS